ncbi:MAG: hypothetical protein RDV48_17660 [Candidatus Eremiobacteraeota bacterium]|nr:hypothetical protein [Candidatus Eremiobacteraeota bacterium]
MASEEKLTRFVIRTALKDLQSRKHFKTLDELKEALEGELRDDGFEVTVEDRGKIAAIVEEEGYTGRFAVDDLIRRKLRNRKYWPAISIAAGVLLFIITSAIGGLIEYFVQKPLTREKPQAPAPTVIAAIFQVPERIYGEKLEFTVSIQNLQKSEALNDLILFASADESVTKIPVGQLEPTSHRKIRGLLKLKSTARSRVTFNAYIISSRVSFVADPVEIEKSGVVAMTMEKEAPSSTSDKLIAMKDSKEAGAPKRDNSMAGGAAQGESRLMKTSSALPQKAQPIPGPAGGGMGGGMIGPGGAAGGGASAGDSAAESESSRSMPVPLKDLTAREMSSDRLADASIEALKSLPPGDPSFQGRREMLGVLAESGNKKAAQFLKTLGR